MPLANLGLLALLGAMFGSAFLFTRVATPFFGPILLVDLRVLLAAGVLLIWLLATRQNLSFRRPLRHWIWLGALNAAAPFTLLAWAALHLTAALASILIATLPLFTSIVSAVWLRQRLSARQLAGLLLGFCGVGVLGGGSGSGLTAASVPAIVAVLLASLFYAIGSLYAKHHFAEVPRLTLAIGNFLAAGLLLLPLNLVTPLPALPTMSTALALLALVVVSTVLPFVLYFRLIHQAGTVTATSVAFLVPAFGAVWGTVFLAEPVTSSMLVGFGLIIPSIVLVTGMASGGLRLPQGTSRFWIFHRS